jgi:single-strand DNA-binding protein
MNKVELIGRLTKEPEIKLTSNQTQYCNFTVAVDRRFKDANGQRQADFINCVGWKNTAVFIQKYFHKGNKIGVVGSIQTRSYDDQNGQKHFVTEVIADEVEFVESQPSAQTAPQPATAQNETAVTADTSAPAPEPQSEPAELPFEI